MSKIYMRLLLTPEWLREGERVLRFAGEEREGEWVTAWEQLRGHLRVSGETATKALKWMHGQGVIGYYAGKNGVGIRIFLNRAAGSVAPRTGARPQKILPFAHASENPSRTSAAETPFNDSFAVTEILDTDIKSRAPKSGADTNEVGETPARPARPTLHSRRPDATPSVSPQQTSDATSVADVLARLTAELGPMLDAAARQAAAREHERTREWLENRGLPKAARVAQQEAYNVLRKYGVISQAARPSRSQTEVGRGSPAPPVTHALSDDEVDDLAQACLAILEIQGRSIELTLSEMNAEAGGFLPPGDAARVRDRANALLSAADGGGGNLDGGRGEWVG